MTRDVGEFVCMHTRKLVYAHAQVGVCTRASWCSLLASLSSLLYSIQNQSGEAGREGGRQVKKRSRHLQTYSSILLISQGIGYYSQVLQNTWISLDFMYVPWN